MSMNDVTTFNISQRDAPLPPPIPTRNGLNASVIARAFNLSYEIGTVIGKILEGDLAGARWHLDQEIQRAGK